MRHARLAFLVLLVGCGSGRVSRTTSTLPPDHTKWTRQQTLEGPRDNVVALAFSRDGRILAAGGGPFRPAWRVVKMWDVATAQYHGGFEIPGSLIRSVAFSPSGAILAIAGSDPASSMLWPVEAGQSAPSVGFRGDGDVAFLPDGALLALSDSSLWRWDLITGTKTRVTDGQPSGQGLAVSRDGKRIAFGEKILDATNGEQLAEIPNETIQSVAFTPDGRRLATTGAKSPAKLWDARSGEYLFSLEAPEALTLAISRDGTFIATGHADGSVRIWNAESGKQLAELRGHKRMVLSVAIAPDGRTIASGDKRGDVLLWEVGSASQSSQR